MRRRAAAALLLAVLATPVLGAVAVLAGGAGQSPAGVVSGDADASALVLSLLSPGVVSRSIVDGRAAHAQADLASAADGRAHAGPLDPGALAQTVAPEARSRCAQSSFPQAPGGAAPCALIPDYPAGADASSARPDSQGSLAAPPAGLPVTFSAGRFEARVGPGSAGAGSGLTELTLDGLAPGLVRVAHATGRSSLTARAAGVTSSAEAVLDGVTIAGVLSIRSIRTRAAVGSAMDGSGSTEATVVVEGASVGGVSAVIDGAGVHLLGPAGTPAGMAATRQIESLGAAGLRIGLPGSTRTRRAGFATAAAAGLSVVQTLPDGTSISLLLGSVDVQAVAVQDAAAAPPPGWAAGPGRAVSPSPAGPDASMAPSPAPARAVRVVTSRAPAGVRAPLRPLILVVLLGALEALFLGGLALALWPQRPPPPVETLRPL